jgi:hypothetical protein
MVGMDVGFQGPEQLEPQLLQQRGVAPCLLEHRIDHHRLAVVAIGEQVGVGRGLRVEELSEYQHARAKVPVGVKSNNSPHHEGTKTRRNA